MPAVYLHVGVLVFTSPFDCSSKSGLPSELRWHRQTLFDYCCCWCDPLSRLGFTRVRMRSCSHPDDRFSRKSTKSRDVEQEGWRQILPSKSLPLRKRRWPVSFDRPALPAYNNNGSLCSHTLYQSTTGEAFGEQKYTYILYCSSLNRSQQPRRKLAVYRWL